MAKQALDKQYRDSRGPRRKQHYAYYANPKCFKRKLTFISLSDLWSCTSFHSLCDCTSFHSLYRYRYSLYRYYYMYRS